MNRTANTTLVTPHRARRLVRWPAAGGLCRDAAVHGGHRLGGNIQLRIVAAASAVAGLAGRSQELGRIGHDRHADPGTWFVAAVAGPVVAQRRGSGDA